MRYRHIRDEEPYFHRIAQMLDLLETKKFTGLMGAMDTRYVAQVADAKAVVLGSGKI